MMRDAKTDYPGAVRAVELLLLKDGREAASEAEAETIIRSELDAQDRTIAKSIHHRKPTPPT